MNKDIKFSEYYLLNKTQFELDFIDIYIHKDVPLFLDPWAIRQSGDDFSNLCHSVISDFFDSLLMKIKDGDTKSAMIMLSGLGEPSETHLGYSKNSISGSGVGTNKSKLIFNALSESEAVKTGFLHDLEDTALLIEGIKEDNISDIVTNLLRFQLIKYTEAQCKLHNITLRNLPTGYYWNNKTEEWESSRQNMLVVEGKMVILVPKLFVRKTLSMDFKEYYNFDIIEFEQALHMQGGSSLCRTLKDGTIKEPTKKSLREFHPKSKQKFVYDFTKKHPEILANYKKKKLELGHTTDDIILDDSVNLNKVIDELTTKLKSITPGRKQAGEYERLISSILEIIFYPNLYHPSVQFRQIEGLKIIDICYQNSANKGFFSDIVKAKIACKKIYFECKNYTGDIKNPELDQLNGRFSNQVSEIGFIVCRKIQNLPAYEKRVLFYTKQQHYIISLEDSDLINLLNMKKLGKSHEIDEYLEGRLAKIIGD